MSKELTASIGKDFLTLGKIGLVLAALIACGIGIGHLQHAYMPDRWFGLLALAGKSGVGHAMTNITMMLVAAVCFAGSIYFDKKLDGVYGKVWSYTGERQRTPAAAEDGLRQRALMVFWISFLAFIMLVVLTITSSVLSGSPAS